MTNPKLQNYICTHRKKMGINQKQLAFVLGSKSGSTVCRYEHFECEPSLRTALALEAFFSKPVKQLFAGIYEEVEKKITKRAAELAIQMRKETSDGKVDPKSEDNSKHL